MDALKELANMADKKKGMPDEKETQAKMSVLKHIHKMASDAMGEGINDLSQNKATVMAPDRAGLEDGLKKAASLVSQQGGPLDSNEMDDTPDSMEHDAEMGEDEEEEGDDEDHPGEPEHGGMPPAEPLIQGQIDHEASEGDLSEEDIDALMADLQKQKMALMAKKGQ